MAAGEGKADEVRELLCLNTDGDVTELCTTTYLHIHTNTNKMRNLEKTHELYQGHNLGYNVLQALVETGLQNIWNSSELFLILHTNPQLPLQKNQSKKKKRESFKHGLIFQSPN